MRLLARDRVEQNVLLAELETGPRPRLDVGAQGLHARLAVLTVDPAIGHRHAVLVATREEPDAETPVPFEVRAERLEVAGEKAAIAEGVLALRLRALVARRR